MISLAHARRSDALRRACTTLTVAGFDALALQLAARWAAQHRTHTAAGTPRQRPPGAGVKGALASAELKLFFILVHYKVYPTQRFMGVLLGLTQGRISDGVGRLTAALSGLLDLHKPARQVRDRRELLTREPALQEVILDGTERRLPRPVHAGRQRRYDSGRKKRHTLKNVLVTGGGKVCWCSPTGAGRRHDLAVARTARLRLPKEVTVLADSGFIGLEAGPAALITPWKKPGGGARCTGSGGPSTGSWPAHE